MNLATALIIIIFFLCILSIWFHFHNVSVVRHLQSHPSIKSHIFLQPSMFMTILRIFDGPSRYTILSYLYRYNIINLLVIGTRHCLWSILNITFVVLSKNLSTIVIFKNVKAESLLKTRNVGRIWTRPKKKKMYKLSIKNSVHRIWLILRNISWII